MTCLTEFGNSTDIEKKSLTVNQDNTSATEWLDVGNGCICCSVKDSGVNAIESLMDRSGTFDYILLETTGLADPGNLVPLFWVDEGLGSTIYLDGVVTVVDALNLIRSLEEPVGEEMVEHDHAHQGSLLSTAHLQISHADVVVINKADLVTQQQLTAIEQRVRSINALARIKVTDHSQVPELEGLVLDLHAYDHVSAENLDFASKGHSHLDPAIGSITLKFPALDEKQFVKLDEWLQAVLWNNRLPGQGSQAPWEVHRIKGRVLLSNGNTKMLQGVREIFEFIDTVDVEPQSIATPQASKVVIIGRNANRDGVAVDFQHSLDTYVVH
jgi:G3E family GTPase